MPYIYRDPEKTSSLAILAYVRDHSEAGHCTTVFDVADFLRDVPYVTPKHRLNDASQRLRTLEKSGYLKKVGPTYEDGRVSAASARQALEKMKGPGRPPAIYALTEQGVRYAKGIADLYLNEKGVEIERDVALRLLKMASLLIDESKWRAIVVAPTEKLAAEILVAWGKKNKKTIKISQMSRAVEEAT